MNCDNLTTSNNVILIAVLIVSFIV